MPTGVAAASSTSCPKPTVQGVLPVVLPPVVVDVVPVVVPVVVVPVVVPVVVVPPVVVLPVVVLPLEEVVPVVVPAGGAKETSAVQPAFSRFESRVGRQASS